MWHWLMFSESCLNVPKKCSCTTALTCTVMLRPRLKKTVQDAFGVHLVVRPVAHGGEKHTHTNKQNKALKPLTFTKLA